MNYQKIDWDLLIEVYDPEEAKIIRGLLETAEIPCQIVKDIAQDLYGLTVGPLARILILVPEERKKEAADLLASADNGSSPDET